MTKEIAVKEELKDTQLDNFQSADDILKLAEILIEGKMIPSHLKKPEQVLTVVLKGREIGLGAVAAMENIYYIQGNATCGINVLNALATKAGLGFKTIRDYEYIYQTESGRFVYEEDLKDLKEKYKPYDRITTIRVYRKHHELGMVIENDVSFKWSEAIAMNLSNKENWKKQASNMMFVRALSRAIRRFAADAIMGLYETSEIAESYGMNVEMNENNEVINIE